MYLLDRYTFFLYKFCKEKGSFLIFILVHGIIFLGDWMFRYYLALMIGRVLVFLLSLFYKKGTQVPGKVALFLCPHFLSYVKKPKTIIAVTGTNGKTTVCNMIVDLFLKYDFSIVHNGIIRRDIIIEKENDVYFISVRGVAEILGVENGVVWDDSRKTISIGANF